MLRLWLVAAIAIMLSALPAARAGAQDQGVAVISAPLEGAIVSGLVPITGTATHAQFQRYELAFGYSPNPADTWFSIQEPSTTAVVNEVIGRWDTTQIADGRYTLRLRVYWSEQAFLESFVQNVSVQNEIPTAAPQPPGATATPLSVSTSDAGAAATPTTQSLIVLPPTSAPRPTATIAPRGTGPSSSSAQSLEATLMREAFFDGVRITLISFALLGAYVSLRAALRAGPRR